MRGPFRKALDLSTVRIGVLLHLLMAVAISFVPLFDVLGFERAFVSGLVAAPVSTFVAVSLVRAARSDPASDEQLPRIALRAFVLSIAMLLPTLACGFLVEFFQEACDRSSGIAFLLLVAGGNTVFGTALGASMAVVSPRRGVSIGLAALVLLFSIVLALARLYAEPQIFVYSAPFGYWPGSIYDEELVVTDAILAFRAYTLLIALAMIAWGQAFVDPTKRSKLMLRVGRPRAPAFLWAVVLSAAVLWVRSRGESLGFDLDRQTIERALSRHVDTEHFNLYIDPRIGVTQLNDLIEDHELRYEQLVRFFDLHPKEKIRSFVYADESEKRRLMGAANTQIARPWAREIHIHGFSVPHPVLKHELAHILAGEWGSGPFKVPASGLVLINIGIVEGVAVAADWTPHDLTAHGWSRAMRDLHLAPNLRTTLDITGFWSISSARAYTVAGSFVRYLIEAEGREKFRELYATNDFPKAYGRPLEELVSNWEVFIDALPLPREELLLAEYRFKSPGIFHKVCAHTAANLAREGYRQLASGDLASGTRSLEQLLRYAPGDIHPLLEMSRAFAEKRRFTEAHQCLTRALGTPNLTEKSAAEAREMRANLAWSEGDADAARKGFEEILSLHLSKASDRLQLARLAALDRSPEVQATLQALLVGDLSPGLSLVRLGELARSHPEDGVVRYLYARRLENAEAYEEGIVEAQAALAGDLPGAPILEEAEMMLGRLLFRAGRSREAKEHFEGLEKRAASEVARLEARDWAERSELRFASPEIEVPE